ncbi:MAG: TolC family protein [Chitinophagaceae bacterium]|nr:TolC family protein [Chitinophagaceae bacterium]
MNYRRRTMIAVLLVLVQSYCYAQKVVDTTALLTDSASLPNCVQYALAHQPVIQQSLIDERTTEYQVKNRLADWYPQVNFNYNLQHNFQVQTNIINGNPIALGVQNTSSGQFTLSQSLFNRDVLLAYRSRADVNRQARQTTTSNKIDVAVNVSKAFYDVLASMQQIKVAGEDILRLERSLKDARARYESGIADKTDYKRAMIALNNTVASRKSSEAALKANVQYLKSLMGYPTDGELKIEYDSLQMEREVQMDTLQRADYKSRIEFSLLETQQRLQQANLKYQKWSFLPSLSANGAYNLNYFNNKFANLYTNNFPSSFAALTLTLPIFQGGRRTNNIRIAEWDLTRTNWDIANLKNSVSAEYEQAIAGYKSNYASYLALKENLVAAQEVYDVIQLQYRAGIKTYLEVITSETDLRAARFNYITALYQLLSSKIDVQRALGQINY